MGDRSFPPLHRRGEPHGGYVCSQSGSEKVAGWSRVRRDVRGYIYFTSRKMQFRYGLKKLETN